MAGLRRASLHTAFGPLIDLASAAAAPSVYSRAPLSPGSSLLLLSAAALSPGFSAARCCTLSLLLCGTQR